MIMYLNRIMPYLRMYLADQQIDETFISEVFLQSVLRNHILEEEKQKMLLQHKLVLGKATVMPSFVIDAIPSSINTFTALNLKKDQDNY